jgi:hypothetical protein
VPVSFSHIFAPLALDQRPGLFWPISERRAQNHHRPKADDSIDPANSTTTTTTAIISATARSPRPDTSAPTPSRPEISPIDKSGRAVRPFASRPARQIVLAIGREPLAWLLLALPLALLLGNGVVRP